MDELWRDIDGFDGFFSVSNFGRVKRNETTTTKSNGVVCKLKEKIRSISIHRSGYNSITLQFNGFKKTYTIHRLVAIAFIENPMNLREVNHKDLNKLNNNVENLEWVNGEDNIKHATKHGVQRGEKNSQSKLKLSDVLKIKQMIKEKVCSQKKIAERYGVSDTMISDIKNGKYWKHV